MKNPILVKIKKMYLVICIIIFATSNITYAQSLEKSSDNHDENSNNSNICSTQICKNAATALSKSMDFTVKPCDNFFKHVCGNFKRDIEFPKTKSQLDKYSMMSDVIVEQIAKILEKDIGSEKPKTFELIKTYYLSCLNKSSIESQGLKPLQTILNKLGGWPVVLGDTWKGENFSWIETDELIRSLGYTPKYIFQPFVMRDMDNPSKNILYIRRPQTIVKDFKHAGYLMKAYLDYMIEIAVLLGADRARAQKELNETLAFDLDLTSPYNFIDYISLDMDKDRLTIKQLQQVYPNISWLEYLNNLTYPNFMVDETFEVRLESSIYLAGVQGLLANTTRRVVANYMIWRVIDDSIDYLNDEIRNKKLLFKKASNGVLESESRQADCLDKMITRGAGLLQGISAMYVKNLFKNNTQRKVGEIVSDIYNRYKNVLQNISWLSESTKQTILKKHERLRKVIGYPEKILDMKSLDKYYGGLHFELNNYFQNAMMLNNFTYENSIKELTQLPEENFWLEVGVSANVLVHYHKIYNVIVLPAAILQYPFFDENQPNYINYGSIGFFVGHEITHAYIFEDMPLDENGTQNVWWTVEDRDKFYQKARCYIDRYSNFTPEADRSVFRSAQTFSLTENLADNDGFKVAYSAYKIWKNNHGDEPQLPSLNYTSDQLFWISAASTLCTRRREENRKLQLYTDEHAGEELRINGAISNMPDFGNIFNCPIGSPMNPELKCTFLTDTVSA
ncbi:neprilysin-2-like isoform X1 [Phymastichus coffea]|uniref:neprilysin-2-like isoform X1 n=1 Tax=Phymastichus coffea TaxID=108790 RepID=UPI00273BA3EF|nr:neprilysin-2-like isoform X1 [Phymastichus coffea]